MKPHYLVIQRHTMDDVPILLTDDVEHARYVSKALDPDATLAKYAIAQLRIDPTTPVCVAVIKFNKDGIPTKMEIVRDYEQEDGE